MGFYDAKDGDLVTWLKTKAAVTALVGVADDARIWPDQGQQSWDGNGQAIIFVRSQSNPFHELGAVSPMVHDVVQFFCYGDTREDADALEAVLFSVLCPTSNGKARPLRHQTFGATKVNLIQPASRGQAGTDASVKTSGQYRYWSMAAYDVHLGA